MYLKKINLKNKYALVTGAGKGLGRACSIALAEAGATVIEENQWYHIVLEWDETTWKGYVNGTLDMSVNNSSLIPSVTTDEAIRFSGNTVNSNDPMLGIIDDVRIYNHALPETDVDTIFGESCSSATITPDLKVHIPSAKYQSIDGNLDIWVDFEYFGEGPNGELLWKLKEYGANQ